jgi:hypothetical protein
MVIPFSAMQNVEFRRCTTRAGTGAGSDGRRSVPFLEMQRGGTKTGFHNREQGVWAQFLGEF